MSYTSLAFFIFVAVVAVLYFKFPVKKYQWTVLLAASYFFYLYAGYRYTAYILITTVTTYYAALWIDRITAKSKETLKEHKADWDKEQKKEFRRACEECSEIRRDYLIDSALGKKQDASMTKFILSAEYGMGEERESLGTEPLTVTVEVVGEEA